MSQARVRNICKRASQLHCSLFPFKKKCKQLMSLQVLVLLGTIIGQVYEALPWVQNLKYLKLPPVGDIGASVLGFFIRFGTFLMIMYGFVPIALLVTTGKF